jgi:hypothetical protein
MSDVVGRAGVFCFSILRGLGSFFGLAEGKTRVGEHLRMRLYYEKRPHPEVPGKAGPRRMLTQIAAIAAFILLTTAAHAATKVAVFDFELLDTSTEADIRGPKPDEARRLALITEDVRKRLSEAGYEVIGLAPQKAQIEEAAPFRNCNSCELPIARELGADIEVIGLVQKVSNLILNINFQLRDVASGAVLRAGSADIRNNTDESWMRGISYLIRNRLLDPPLTGKAAAKAATP